MPTFLYPERLATELSQTLKSAVSHALVTMESHVRTPENAEAVLSADQADLVSIVRGQIADPHLANKAKEGRPEDIRPCLSCNQMCWGRRYRDYWISCLVNPPPDVNLNGGETVLRKQHLPKMFLWSEEALQALKLPVWLRNRDTK